MIDCRRDDKVDYDSRRSQNNSFSHDFFLSSMIKEDLFGNGEKPHVMTNV